MKKSSLIGWTLAAGLATIAVTQSCHAAPIAGFPGDPAYDAASQAYDTERAAITQAINANGGVLSLSIRERRCTNNGTFEKTVCDLRMVPQGQVCATLDKFVDLDYCMVRGASIGGR